MSFLVLQPSHLGKREQVALLLLLSFVVPWIVCGVSWTYSLFVVQTIYHVPIFVCMLKFEPDEYWLHDLLGVVRQCYDGDIVLY